MKRLSIKNVQFFEAMSEETNCFVADVYLDNKKFAHAKNQGHGGNTDISPYPNMNELFEEALDYAKNLPPRKSNFGGKDVELPMNLEFAVDLILDDYLKQKDYKKGIVYKTKKGVTYIVQFNRALSTVMKTEQGRKAVQKEVDKIKSEGGKVLNNNLKGINI